MTLFESVTPTMPPAETESSARVLQRLDLTATWLWSCEPDCSPALRHHLVEQLNAVTNAVERLAFRHQFHPDEAVDPRELRRCVSELDRLHRCWNSNGVTF